MPKQEVGLWPLRVSDTLASQRPEWVICEQTMKTTMYVWSKHTCWTKLFKFHTGVSSSSRLCRCSGCSSEKLTGLIANTCPHPNAVYGGYKGVSYPITTFCMKSEEGKQNITQAVLAKNNPFLLVCLLKKQDKQRFTATEFVPSLLHF